MACGEECTMKTFATGDKITSSILNSTMWSFAAYTATTTAITLGTGGVITTNYCRIGTGDLVFFNGYITFGTSPAITATCHITLPTAADVTAIQWCVGSWVFRDDSVPDHYAGSLGIWDTGGAEISFAGAWDGTAPRDRVRVGVPMTVGVPIGSGGTITTNYCRPGRGDLVFFNGHIVFGTSPSFSTVITVTLPTNANTSDFDLIDRVQWCAGSWVFRDNSAVYHYAGSLGVWNVSGTEVSFGGAWNGTSPRRRIESAVPFTVAVDDVLSWEGYYVSNT